MKHLLERWSRLEPHLCKRETRPNVDWHEEFEDYWIKSPETADGVWYQVYSDRFSEGYRPSKEGAMMRIQWAVQQAIIEKGWYFLIRYNNGLCMVETGSVIPSPRYTKDDAEITEVLLSAYLAELEASANP